MQFLKNLTQLISEQILPTACITCQRFQAEYICLPCLNTLESNSLIHYECCSQCGIPLQAQELAEQQCHHCKKRSPFFDETYCLDRYDGVLQDALHQLKYQKRIAFAHGLAKAWNQIASSLLQECHIDYLLPVPLSSEKLLTRGFNQSWELARRIDCKDSIQKLPFALKRYHHSDHQAGNSMNERQDAIRQMFYIDAQYQERMMNKTVVVFDDVMTSGATLNEIARILKEAGVSHVINWVLLRTTRLTH
jgi:ComF family protein